MEIKVTTPNNDDVLSFNENTGHYELTLQYVKSQLDVTFKDDGVTQKRITKNSRAIYNYLLARSYSRNNEIVTFFLNHTENGRRFLKDILTAQMEADLQSGYNDIGLTPAVSANGQQIDRAQIRRNLVCVSAEEIADNNAAYFGFNLLIQTQLPASLYAFVRNHER